MNISNSAAKNVLPKPNAKPTGSKTRPKGQSASKDKVVSSPKLASADKVWDLASKGYKKAVAQSFTASSVSLALRLGSRQVDSLLGTGLASAMSTAGVAIGFAAAGLRLASGTEKIYKSVKTKEPKKALDGLKDYGAASVLGLTCAGMWAARKVALPAAAGFETFRGGYNFAAGYLSGDKKRQAQGVYDGVRAAGRTARALKKVAPFFKTAGLVMAPIAGFMQARKGVKNLALGLKKNNNRLELRGIVDIASAVGTTMLLTGVAAVPGMVLFGSAQLLNTGYRMNSTVRKVLDPVIDKMEPSAHRAADGIRDLKDSAQELITKFPNPFLWTLSSEKVDATALEHDDSSIWYNECFLEVEDDDVLSSGLPQIDSIESIDELPDDNLEEQPEAEEMELH